MAALAERHDPRAITWRFDPICFFCTAQCKTIRHNLDALETIADALAALGVRRCVTSFVDLYRKVLIRLPAKGIELVDPPLDVKCETLIKMAEKLREREISLGICCEQTILEALPPHGYPPRGVYPRPLLAHLFGAEVAVKKDPGQRRAAGCTCNAAVDIGSYRWQPCYHNCLFCYANPQPPNGMAGKKATLRYANRHPAPGQQSCICPFGRISILPLRLLAKEAGCGLVCSEMVSANGLVYGSRKTAQLLQTIPDEYPLAVQLFGVDPALTAEAAPHGSSFRRGPDRHQLRLRRQKDRADRCRRGADAHTRSRAGAPESRAQGDRGALNHQNS